MLAALISLAISFGKIGIFSFGGGNSMLFLIQEECVQKHQWLSASEYSSMLGMSFIFPGLTAVKLAGAIGYHVAGILGLVVSIVAINLPGLILMLAFYSWISRYQSNPIVAKILTAMQYAAVVMIAGVIYSFIVNLSKTYFSMSAIILSILYFVGITIFNTNAFFSLLLFLGVFVWIG